MTDQIEPQEVEQQPVEAQKPAEPVAEDALGVAAEPEEARSNEDDVLMQIDSHEEEVGVAADTEPAVDLPDELKEEQTEQPNADAVSAREVLKRDGWDESDLAGMDEAVLIKMAAHRRKVQQDVDRKLRERGASDSDDRDEETQSDPEPQPAEPPRANPRRLTFSPQFNLLQSTLDLMTKARNCSLVPMRPPCSRFIR